MSLGKQFISPGIDVNYEQSNLHHIYPNQYIKNQKAVESKSDNARIESKKILNCMIIDKITNREFRDAAPKYQISFFDSNPKFPHLSEDQNRVKKVFETHKLGGELFVDAGRLYDFFQNANDFSITWNYGIGFTYDTAIGPIRIEYAIPYTTSLANNETVHASILYMF